MSSTRLTLVLAALAALAALPTLSACSAADAGSRAGDFEEVRVSVGFETSDALALDVDRDGVPEAVLAGAGEIAVLGADGRGGFRVVERAPAGPNPVGLAAGDLDGDGWADLVVANHETDHVTLLFGGPDGFAGGRRDRIAVGVSPHPHAVAVGDLDGDGHLDFVVDDRDAGVLRHFRGTGDGRFREAGPVEVGGDPYRGMVLADLNGDGHLDVVTPNERAVAVRFGSGEGAFTPGPDLAVPGISPFSVAVGDVNGDGVPDIGVGGGEGERTFAVWLGDGGGRFVLEEGSPHRIPEGPTRVRAARVDGDGHDDFLVASWVGDGVVVMLGGAEGLRSVRIEVDGNPWGVDAGDFDGDGDVDLIVGRGGAPEVSFFVRDGGSRP